MERAALDREKEVGLFALYKLSATLAVHNMAPFKGTVFTRTVATATINFIPSSMWLLIKGESYLRAVTVVSIMLL